MRPLGLTCFFVKPLRSERGAAGWLQIVQRSRSRTRKATSPTALENGSEYVLESSFEGSKGPFEQSALDWH